MENQNSQAIVNLRETVNNKLQRLSGKLPKYEDLSDEAKSIVNGYLAQLDTTNPKSIDEFGKDTTEQIYSELDMLIGNLRTHDISIDEMFTSLMLDINGNGNDRNHGFLKTLKNSGSITKAARTLMNKPKQIVETEKYRRSRVLDNIGTIREKLEEIRSELALNAEKLECMAQTSATQYQNFQYQMIALGQLSQQLAEEEQQQDTSDELSLMQIDQSIQNSGMQKRINRKLENLQGVAINAATKAIMARLLAQHNRELASDYDQDLATLLPELKSLIVTAQANDSLISSADTHNQFVQKMNEMLQEESHRSQEAIEKVQAISRGSVIDVETAKTLTSDVLTVVSSLKKAQMEARPTNEAFAQLFEEFRGNLEKVVNEPTVRETSTKGRFSATPSCPSESAKMRDEGDER